MSTTLTKKKETKAIELIRTEAVKGILSQIDIHRKLMKEGMKCCGS